MPPRPSAGILLYRKTSSGFEVLIGHPGGPFWAKRHEGAWSLLKGELDDGEDIAAAARREFAEESGHEAPEVLTALGSVKQRSGKIVHGFAAEGDLDPDTVASNMIDIEWPPRSKETITIPEIDVVQWCTPDLARSLLNEAQRPFVDRLVGLLK